MTGFFLLLGHLIGDYILQNDYLALNKSNPRPGPRPVQPPPTVGYAFIPGYWEEKARDWGRARAQWILGNFTCTVHCFLYTFAVFCCSFWWMPLWGLVACFALHWPIDRFRLARWWMTHVSDQTQFATGPLSPWSIILVDNVFHLLTLGGIYLAACGVPAGCSVATFNNF